MSPPLVDFRRRCKCYGITQYVYRIAMVVQQHMRYEIQVNMIFTDSSSSSSASASASASS